MTRDIADNSRAGEVPVIRSAARRVCDLVVQARRVRRSVDADLSFQRSNTIVDVIVLRVMLERGRAAI